MESQLFMTALGKQLTRDRLGQIPNCLLSKMCQTIVVQAETHGWKENLLAYRNRGWGLLRGNRGYLRSHSWGPGPRHPWIFDRTEQRQLQVGHSLVIFIGSLNAPVGSASHAVVPMLPEMLAQLERSRVEGED